MNDQKIVLGADHAGVELKSEIKNNLLALGWQVTDFGTNDRHVSCDYTDIAQKVAAAIVAGDFARGILICGTGLGMSYAANRFHGIRAALCWSCESAQLARSHNDSNILVLPSRIATIDPLADIVLMWMRTEFSHGERHCKRIAKIEQFKNNLC